MEEFDFENIVVLDENLGEDEFFSQDDDDEEDPSGGVRIIPRPKKPSGSHGKSLEEKEVSLV